MGRNDGFRAGRHVVNTEIPARSDRVRSELEGSIRKVCKDFEAELLESDGEDDHLHLLIAYPPKVALSRLVNSLKGVSSRHIRSLDLPELRDTGSTFWSASYCAVSCGGAPLETIKRYIQDQRRDA